ncbi:MAG: hypothetical protein V2A74_08365 [bacterium]
MDENQAKARKALRRLCLFQIAAEHAYRRLLRCSLSQDLKEKVRDFAREEEEQLAQLADWHMKFSTSPPGNSAARKFFGWAYSTTLALLGERAVIKGLSMLEDYGLGVFKQQQMRLLDLGYSEISTALQPLLKIQKSHAQFFANELRRRKNT